MQESLRRSLKQVWENLGSDDASRTARLNEILGHFYKKMHDDVMIGFFFVGRDLQQISEKQGEFLMRAMGARATYSGKPPNQAHLALPPIRRGQFDRRLVLLRETLKAHELSLTDIESWIAFEEAFRSTVEG